MCRNMLKRAYLILFLCNCSYKRGPRMRHIRSFSFAVLRCIYYNRIKIETREYINIIYFYCFHISSKFNHVKGIIKNRRSFSNSLIT
ncbi:hypothetical protein HZS_4003 [Henneguya salminicola]|nr:hypothetical protein HZS_4003 [Henneguya salminicola]